jgi:hypothetical protein
MAGPSWLAATAGQPAYAGQLNQFLASHGATWLYAGTQQAAQTTGNAVYSASNGQYIAQSFTTGVSQTAVGQVWLQVSAVGGSPVTQAIPPLTLALYASSGGAPTGAALGSVAVNETYVYNAPFWVQFPLAVSGLTPSTVYQLVTFPAGASANYYAWQHSNQVIGGSLSADGVTWTTQAFGFMYQVFDQSAGGNLLYITEDGGARWTSLTYDAFNRVSTITEYTTGATALTSVRTFAYSNGSLTGVS